MATNPHIYHRRSLRLHGYDYAQAGAYFITLCVQNTGRPFGQIVDGNMQLSTIGAIVRTSWEWLESQYDDVQLDEFVVMPDHLHGILVLAPVPHIKRKPIGRFIGAFKTVSTKQINLLQHTPGTRIWQRNYYEHIIRNENSLQRIRTYITTNPTRWANK